MSASFPVGQHKQHSHNSSDCRVRDKCKLQSRAVTAACDVRRERGVKEMGGEVSSWALRSGRALALDDRRAGRN